MVVRGASRDRQLVARMGQDVGQTTRLLKAPGQDDWRKARCWTWGGNGVEGP